MQSFSRTASDQSSFSMTNGDADAMQEAPVPASTPPVPVSFSRTSSADYFQQGLGMPLSLSPRVGSGSFAMMGFPTSSAPDRDQDQDQDQDRDRDQDQLMSFEEQPASGAFSRAPSGGLPLTFSGGSSSLGMPSASFSRIHSEYEAPFNGEPQSLGAMSRESSGSFALPFTSSGSSDHPSLAVPSLSIPSAQSIYVAPLANPLPARSASSASGDPSPTAMQSPIALMQSHAQTVVSGIAPAVHSPLSLPAAPAPLPMVMGYPVHQQHPSMGYPAQPAFAVPRSESQTQVAHPVHTPSQSPVALPATALTATQTLQASIEASLLSEQELKQLKQKVKQLRDLAFCAGKNAPETLKGLISFHEARIAVAEADREFAQSLKNSAEQIVQASIDSRDAAIESTKQKKQAKKSAPKEAKKPAGTSNALISDGLNKKGRGTKRKAPSGKATESSKAYPDDDVVTIGEYTKGERREKKARFDAKKVKWGWPIGGVITKFINKDGEVSEEYKINRAQKRGIVYEDRKKFAQSRPRVGGRFLKGVRKENPKHEPKPKQAEAVAQHKAPEPMHSIASLFQPATPSSYEGMPVGAAAPDTSFAFQEQVPSEQNGASPAAPLSFVEEASESAAPPVASFSFTGQR